MARPLKKGLDYYPLSRDDKRFEAIRAVQPVQGFEVLAYLFAELHEVEGYFLPWDDRAMKRFCLKYSFKEKVVKEIVKDCLIDGVFDEELLGAHKILTSYDCQLIWANAVKERLGIEYNQAYILIDLTEVLETIEKNKERAEKKENNRQSKKEKDNELKDSNIFGITPQENQQGNPQENNQGNTQDNYIREEKRSKEKQSEEKESEAEENLNFSNSTSKEVPAGENSNTESKKAKTKKAVHPARAGMIQAWEQKFGLGYSQTLNGNQGINHIIKCLERNILLRQPDTSPEQLPELVLQTFQALMQNWGRLENFYQMQVAFDKIAKNIDNILVQLNGTQSISGKTNSRPSAASFAGKFDE